MKRKTSTVIFILLILSLSFGCKKENEKKPYCRITKLVRNGTLAYEIGYGDNEKISSLKPVPGTEASTYKYESGKTIITYTNNGNFDYRMIVSTDKNGFATNARMEFNQSGSQWYNQAFTYDGTKITSNKVTEFGGDSASVDYTWENGNISVSIQEGDVTHYTYYEDKPFQTGEWRDIQQLLAGYKIYATKNLLKSAEINGNTTYFTYVFDADGKIVEAKSTLNSTTTFAIEYDCQ